MDPKDTKAQIDALRDAVPVPPAKWENCPDCGTARPISEECLLCGNQDHTQCARCGVIHRAGVDCPNCYNLDAIDLAENPPIKPKPLADQAREVIERICSDESHLERAREEYERELEEILGERGYQDYLDWTEQRDAHLGSIQNGIANKKDRLKEVIKKLGRTVAHLSIKAVYSKGRRTVKVGDIETLAKVFDAQGKEEDAQALRALVKTGKPSVRIS